MPNQTTLFQGRLGTSNEPFLNKPARFTHLSDKNAVRKGEDFETLNRAIAVLGDKSLEKNASQALKDCIYFILQREERVTKTGAKTVATLKDESLKIAALLDKFLTQSYEGETSAIVVGALLKTLYAAQASVVVKVHPANQAGSSSREICDIDVLVNGAHVFGAEVKDKNYSTHDIEHAVGKAVDNNLTKLLFVEGRQVKNSAAYTPPKDFNFYRTGIDAFVSSTLSVSLPLDVEGFSALLRNTANEMRAKDTTFAWLKRCTE